MKLNNLKIRECIFTCQMYVFAFILFFSAEPMSAIMFWQWRRQEVEPVLETRSHDSHHHEFPKLAMLSHFHSHLRRSRISHRRRHHSHHHLQLNNDVLL